jgi:3-methyladenine DNA glycosylase AlkD
MSITVSPAHQARFFKMTPGTYGAHDQFLGVTTPTLRKIAKQFKERVTLSDIQHLIQSPFNEERLLALFLLIQCYQNAHDLSERQMFYDFYLSNLAHINNWNLVDASAHLIVGAHLYNNDKQKLHDLAHSHIMWERRIAIVATWYFIKQADLDWTFQLAKCLLNDPHDLIHKATGWMLREAGKKDEAALTLFLNNCAKQMPRTMLRYAIEKFETRMRERYLRG